MPWNLYWYHGPHTTGVKEVFDAEYYQGRCEKKPANETIWSGLMRGGSGGSVHVGGLVHHFSAYLMSKLGHKFAIRKYMSGESLNDLLF